MTKYHVTLQGRDPLNEIEAITIIIDSTDQDLATRKAMALGHMLSFKTTQANVATPNESKPSAPTITVQAKLNPADEAHYTKSKNEAAPAHFEIARTLQRAAFALRTDGKPRPHLDDPHFEPAPLYLEQALAITKSPELANSIISSLAEFNATPQPSTL